CAGLRGCILCAALLFELRTEWETDGACHENGGLWHACGQMAVSRKWEGSLPFRAGLSRGAGLVHGGCASYLKCRGGVRGLVGARADGYLARPQAQSATRKLEPGGCIL